MIQQLRIYTINPDLREQFHVRFKDHAMRIMKSYDFHILDMWESETDGKVEFVYILEWTDEENLKAQWEKFMADPEWNEIKRQTAETMGEMVIGKEERILKRILT